MIEYVPAGWQLIHGIQFDGSHQGYAVRTMNGLFVIISEGPESDGNIWRHVSCSRRSRIPDWDDIRLVKELFIGKNEEAIQVFPPESEYVNICKFALHLWSRKYERVLPDFRKQNGSIGKAI